MNKIFLAILLSILVFLLINPITLGFIKNRIPGSFGQNGNIKFATSGIMTSVFFILCLLFLYMANVKEGFFFEVTKNRPRCQKGFIGRPTSFEFTGTLDANNGCTQFPDGCNNNQGGFNCAEVDKEKENKKFGWDGLQNINPDRSNIVGAMGYCNGLGY